MGKYKKSPIMKTKNLTIKFGDFIANNNINIEILPGEIHSVVGENGAGKSTLMKMLYGVYQPTNGEIYIGIKKMELTPARAINCGIGMVFQDFRLIPAFTALENIILAMPNDGRNIDTETVKRKIIKLSQKYKIPIEPDMNVWEMDLGQRQRVEIIKVLMMGDNMKLLIFDEPTSVLTQHEAVAFIDMIQVLKKEGIAILLITHKLHEVMACSDTISILRHGEIIYTINREEGYEKEDLIAKMMGVDTHQEIMNFDHIKENNEKNITVLKCQNLGIKDEHYRNIIENINLEIKAGEIIGIAGISGRGQRELLETIYGVRKKAHGQIFLNDKEISDLPIEKRITAGVSLISEDPKRDNVVSGMRILEHFLLAGVSIIKKGLRLDLEALLNSLNNREELKMLGVPTLEREMITLSGGNIQRVVLARALLSKPKILLASYPSRGLDVGTVEMVHKALIKLRNKGSGILLVSEDLEELFKISDTLIVIAEGEILGKFDSKSITPYDVGELMIGGKK